MPDLTAKSEAANTAEQRAEAAKAIEELNRKKQTHQGDALKDIKEAK